MKCGMLETSKTESWNSGDLQNSTYEMLESSRLNCGMLEDFHVSTATLKCSDLLCFAQHKNEGRPNDSTDGNPLQQESQRSAAGFPRFPRFPAKSPKPNLIG